MRGPMLGIAVALVIGCSQPEAPRFHAEASEPPTTLVLDDAYRFEALFKANDLSAEALQEKYLAPGTEGLAIFMPMRIKDAANLAKKIAANPAGYSKAIELCLPAARAFASQDAADVMQSVAAFLGEPETAPAYALFGADNSGGTADKRGLVIGLEVLCRFAHDNETARTILEDFVAHEITHVYQQRARDWSAAPSLLEAALVEGFADFVMEKMLGRPSAASKDRAEYGAAHEGALWQEFKTDVDRAAGYGDWLYRELDGDRPADLAYWIGQRICETYYAKAEDKEAALRELLLVQDAPHILAASGYDGAHP